MTLPELTTRFPEIPADLHAEPVLQAFADTFGPYLLTATKPSACLTDRTSENNAYMTLIAPLDIYCYGLSSRERVLEQSSFVTGQRKNMHCMKELLRKSTRNGSVGTRMEIQ